MSEPQAQYRVFLDNEADIENGWGVCSPGGGVLYSAENMLSKVSAELLADAHNQGCESYEEACAYIVGENE